MRNIFRSSITRYLMAAFTVLTAGLVTASVIIAVQAWSRYALAGRIAELAQADRRIFDALFEVRAQVPRVSTALLGSDDPEPVIRSAHAGAEQAVQAAQQALIAADVPTGSAAAAHIESMWQNLERRQRQVRQEAYRPQTSRDLHDLDQWRESVHRTTDALGAASVLISNEIRIGDAILAEMMQIRRLAWTVRDHYGLQCSMLRPSLAANSPLNGAQLEAWAGDRAVYLSAWQSLDELLLRPALPEAIRERVDVAREATRVAQQRIDDIVAQLNARGKTDVDSAAWTALCDGPFESILSIARSAQRSTNDRADAMRATALRMLLWSCTGLCAAVIFGGWVLLTVQHRLARPMRSLIATIARLSRRELREAVPAPDSPDELGRMSEALEDLRASALEAERLQATMSRFTADASHQMRTPLSILRTHIDVLEHLIPPAEAAHASLLDIRGAADRLQHLLIQLLKLARAEGWATGEAESGATDLRSIMQEVASSHAPQALNAQLQLHFEAESKPHPCGANPVVVKEILSNLIDNAILYNSVGGHVLVRLLELNGCYVAEVEDTGPGIPETEREKVFTRFYRMNRDQSRPGSGLGLAIVRSFAASIGAQVTMRAGSGNRGLCVRIAFPF